MPQIKYTSSALKDLERLREFLRTKNSSAARRASEKIIKSIHILTVHPQIGRPVPDMSKEFRDWIIDFGSSGYVIRWRCNSSGYKTSKRGLLVAPCFHH